MKMLWQIRAAEQGDIEAILSLWSNIEEIKSAIVDSYKDVQNFMAVNPNSLLVACSGDEVIGAVMGGYNGWRGTIYHLAVHVNYRRQGIGKALLNSCLDTLQRRGAPRVDLYTYASNAKAQALYRKLGWQERSNIKNFSWFFPEKTG